MIRPAMGEDVGALHALWRALWEEQASDDAPLRLSADADERWANDLPYWLRDGETLVLVLEGGGAVVGFARAELWRPPPIHALTVEAHINEVYVAPDYRREGWGRRLVEAVEAWAMRRGASAIRAGVLAGNASAEAFWSGLGAAPAHTVYRKPLPRPQEAPAGPPGPPGF